MTIGSTVIETGEDGEFIAHASDRKESPAFRSHGRLLGKSILMPTKVGADGNPVFAPAAAVGFAGTERPRAVEPGWLHQHAKSNVDPWCEGKKEVLRSWLTGNHLLRTTRRSNAMARNKLVRSRFFLISLT